MRKFTCILLVCVMLTMVFGCSTTVFAGSEGVWENLNWRLSDEGVLTLWGNGPLQGWQFPWTENIADIKKVVIKEGVSSVSYGAFENGTSIEEVTIADSVKFLDSSAFSGCTALKTINWGNGLEIIGANTFSWSGLESVALPDSVKVIKGGAFSGCESLTALTLPDDIEFVDGTFIDETPLYNSLYTDGDEDVYFGDVLLKVNSSDESYTIKDGTRIIAAYSFHCYSLTSLVIPDSVEYIGDYAFDKHEALKSVTIGKGVKKIGDYAFYRAGLTSVEIPGNVEVIGDSAFSRCADLKGVTFNEGLKNICRQAFSVSGVTEVIIPDSVTNIDHAAFNGCDSLKNVVIGDGVLFCDGGAFEGESVESLTIGNSVADFSVSTFLSDMPALKNLVIGDAIKDMSIIKNLDNPELLESLTLGKGITIIEENVMAELTGLKSIDISDNVTVIGIDAFIKTAFYKDSANWENGALYADNCLIDVKAGTTSVNVKEGTVCIGPNAFENAYDTLSSVTLPKSLRSINRAAFVGCYNLKSISLPDGIIEIGDSAFSGTGIYKDTSNWDNGKFYIGKYLVGSDATVKDFSIKAGTLCIAGKVFEKTRNNFAEIIVPDSVVSISSRAFYNCGALKNIEFGKGLKYIGENAFYRCAFESITIPESVEQIGEQAFISCDKLRTAEIKGGEIGKEAFSRCSSLSKITLGDKVTGIGERAFNQNVFEKIIIPDSVTSIGDKIFGSTTTLKRVSIGSGVKYLNDIIENTPVTDLILTNGIIQVECDIIHNDGNLKNIYYGGTKAEWQDIIHSTHYADDMVYPVVHFDAVDVPDIYDVTISGNGTYTPIGVKIELENPENGGKVVTVIKKDGVIQRVVTKDAAAVVEANFELGDKGTSLEIFWWDGLKNQPLCPAVLKNIQYL